MKNIKSNLTYLSIDSIQEGVGASQILSLLHGLAKRDLEVSLVTFEKKKPPIYLEELVAEIGINWKILDFGQAGVMGGLKRLELLRKSIPNTELIHGRSDVPTAAAILSRIDVPVLWDVRSLWSDQRLQINSKGWNKTTSYAARKLENLSALKATGMSTLTKAVIPILENRHKRLPSIRNVIPTCVRTDIFTPTLMPKGKYLCLLSGTYNNYYDLERTKVIIQQLKMKMHLEVIWAKPAESCQSALNVGEDRIIEVQHSEMPSIIRESHFGIAICKNDNPQTLSAAMPTKVAEFLASGRPMIVSSGLGDLDYFIMRHEAGIVIHPSTNISGISEKLINMLDNPETIEKCRNLALSEFSIETAVDKYTDMYKRMWEEYK